MCVHACMCMPIICHNTSTGDETSIQQPDHHVQVGITATHGKKQNARTNSTKYYSDWVLNSYCSQPLTQANTNHNVLNANVAL